ncbi:MAG: cupin domain-containing protein [Myxococcota bacterium]
MPITIKNPKNKDRVTFLETGRQNNGARTLLEVVLAPGGRNALHYHTTFAEHFEAVEGTLQLATASGDHHLEPGERFTAPPYALHAFFNDSGSHVRFHVEIRPANERFEYFLQVAYGLINDTWTLPGGFPLHPLYLGVLYELGDTHYKGILGLMTPMAELASFIATRVGTRQRLIQRYCQTRLLPAHTASHTD